MTQIPSAELIDQVKQAQARYSKMQEDQNYILEGKEKAQEMLQQAQERLGQTEGRYQKVAVFSPGSQEEREARAALESARGDLAQAQDRATAFEQLEGEMFAHLGEREFQSAQNNLDSVKRRAWEAVSREELARFPADAMQCLKRAWAAAGIGPFDVFAKVAMGPIGPSDKEFRPLREELSKEYGLLL